MTPLHGTTVTLSWRFDPGTLRSLKQECLCKIAHFNKISNYHPYFVRRAVPRRRVEIVTRLQGLATPAVRQEFQDVLTRLESSERFSQLRRNRFMDEEAAKHHVRKFLKKLSVNG
jgi:hypothetical protein